MTKVAMYLRQSLDQHQTGLAVDRQRKACRELCVTKGWEAVEYVDNSISASSGRRRPAYEQMLADIESGAIKGVVSWDLDRLHRRPIELEHFIDVADTKRLMLATVTGDVDLSTHNGRLYARIKGAVARGEMEQKSQRQKLAQAQRREMGLSWGPRRPFGFESDHVSHHADEAPIVRKMFTDALAGVPQLQIMRDLNDRGIKTSMGNAWGQSSVRQLLRNPRYAGLMTDGGEIVGEAGWEPIVDPETFMALRSKLSANPPSQGGKRRYMMSGLAVCGVCGTKVNTMQSRTKKRLYRCPKNHVGRNADHVDALVRELVVGRLSMDDAKDLLVDDKGDDFTELASQRDVLRTRQDQLAVEFADGDLTASQLKAATERLTERIAALESQMGRSVQAPALERVIASDDAAAAWAELDVHRKRQVVDALMTVTINTTVKGAQIFRPEDIGIAWK